MGLVLKGKDLPFSLGNEDAFTSCRLREIERLEKLETRKRPLGLVRRRRLGRTDHLRRGEGDAFLQPACLAHGGVLRGKEADQHRGDDNRGQTVHARCSKNEITRL